MVKESMIMQAVAVPLDRAQAPKESSKMTSPPFDEGELRRPGHPRLYTRVYPPAGGEARADVLFLHGYDDHSGRYASTLAMLAGEGYRVVAFDARGHGRSEGRRGFCRVWEEYLEDVDAVLAHAGRGARPLFLLGQSHGSLVAAHWALRHPGEAAGLVLCGSYLRLVMPVPRLKVAMARTLNVVAPSLRLGSEVRVEYLSSDPEWQRATREDRLLSRVATPRWFCTSTAAQADLLARTPDLHAPTLLLHGEADPIADPAAVRELFDRLGSDDKELHLYPGFLHEPLNERGREQVWADLRDWLGARLPNRLEPQMNTDERGSGAS